MSMVTVSARIDEATKVLGNDIIKRRGLTPNEVIGNLYERIVETGEVPEAVAGKSHSDKTMQAFKELDLLVSDMPTGTPLASMSYEDLKAEWTNRDI